MSTETATPSVNWVSTLTPVLVSAITTAVTIAFMLGGAKNDIKTIADTQVSQNQKIEDLYNKFNSLDKNQAVMAREFTNFSSRFEERAKAWDEMNEDMRCIRYVLGSKGDISQCR
jgi:hypothetical protein